MPWWVAEGREEEFIERPPYVRAIWMWAYMVRRCHRYFGNLKATERVLQLKYETFMQDPHSAGKQILEHLDRSDTRAFH